MPELRPPNVPAVVHQLADAVAHAGGRLYLVGGGVRDHLMGAPVKDWDLEVFGLSHDALHEILRRRGSVNTVGRSFGVLKWRPHGGSEQEIDVSIPRRDSKVGPGHRGIAVEGDPNMSTREATRRRDLTINAMMWDLGAGRLEDPWDGRRDLHAGVLRAVDEETFLEDPLRALRVVQFAARLGFSPDPSLIALCRRAALDELPAERIQGEWGKLLLKGRDLRLGYSVARATGVLVRVFPTVADLATDDAIARAATLRDPLEPEGRRWALMLGAWLHPAPAPAVEAVLDRLGLHTARGYAVRERLVAVLAALSDPLDSDRALRHLSTRAELTLLLAVRAAIGGEDLTPVRARATALGILEHAPPPLLLGRHLRGLVEPGRRMGEILAEVYTAQLDGTVTDLEGARAFATDILSR